VLVRDARRTLRTVREATGKTQVDVARESQIDQADVSRLEGRVDFDDCQVATIRRYLAAIGGQLELVARFGNKRIVLVGAPRATATVPANKASQRTGRKPAPPLNAIPLGRRRCRGVFDS
jgi:predicted transcriptional regulator